MIVFDALALLAYLQGEEGESAVEGALAEGVVGAANWSEVAQKVMGRGGDWNLASTLLTGYGLRVVPVLLQDGEVAAQMWQDDRSLSLADRLCMALARRLEAPVMAADKAWGNGAGIRQIR